MKINLKDYTDAQIKSLKEYADTNFTLDRKAVDQYSKTNDEWKLLHNGLQRKMEEDRANYVTKDMLNKQSLLIIAIMGLLVTIYEVFVKPTL